MLHEFEIIERFFHQPSYFSAGVIVGVGDDAAVMEVPAGFQVVTTIDALVEKIHFPADAKPYALGYKSLAVSLSDIAAMGAIPRSVLLALTLPSANEAWLKDYAQGFFDLAKQHRVDLIGGNITRGPLSMTVVADGLVPQGEMLLRSGAKTGDLIYITGTLGDAGLALSLLEKNDQSIDEFLLKRFYQPTPRVAAGIVLRGLATAAIDISDGFCADLEKLLVASQVGARVYAERLPLSAPMRRHVDPKSSWQFALNAGEDYELCFTIPPDKKSQLDKIMMALGCDIHYVGDVVAGSGLSIVDPQEQLITLKKKGYEHF